MLGRRGTRERPRTVSAGVSVDYLLGASFVIQSIIAMVLLWTSNSASHDPYFDAVELDWLFLPEYHTARTNYAHESPTRGSGRSCRNLVNVEQAGVTNTKTTQLESTQRMAR